MDDLHSLSDSISALARSAAARLFHVPSSLGGRTALGFDGKRLLVPAFDAEEGESLEILGPGGEKLSARVAGFDPKLSLAVLELASERPSTAFVPMSGMPAPGSLVVTVAFPSPQGPEARLDLIRFSGGEGEDAYVQTDGAHFPGFSGSALVAPDGTLAGFVVTDRGGNRSWALPASRAAELALSIAQKGFVGGAWLGVSTVPVEAPDAFRSLFGDDRESALMVAGVEQGSPAAEGGILAGDILVAIDGKPVTSPEELRSVLDGSQAGAKLALVLIRGGRRLESTVAAGERPRESRGQAMGWGAHHGPGPRGWRWGGMPWGCTPGR
ncbi:MAG: S1C family serine protease [Rectinemataceae bacterium]